MRRYVVADVFTRTPLQEEIGRPSTLYARAVGSADRIERVEVGGSAVLVARGEYRVD